MDRPLSTKLKKKKRNIVENNFFYVLCNGYYNIKLIGRSLSMKMPMDKYLTETLQRF